MSNEEIYRELEKTFTRLGLLNYCLIRSKESLILFEDDAKKRNLPSEHEHDVMWWDKKYYIIRNELHDENRTIIGETPKSN